LSLDGHEDHQGHLRGVRDPLKLAKNRHERCHASEAEIARSLQGNWRQDHLFALKQALQMYEFYHRQTPRSKPACARSPTRVVARSLTGKVRKQQRANAVSFDARTLLFRMAGVDVTVIEGISELTGLTVLSEIGTDMSRFPHEKNFVSWLGLCPNHRGSAGKIFSRRVRKGANRAARALRLAAQSCHRAKNALGRFIGVCKHAVADRKPWWRRRARSRSGCTAC